MWKISLPVLGKIRKWMQYSSEAFLNVSNFAEYKTTCCKCILIKYSGKVYAIAGHFGNYFGGEKCLENEKKSLGAVATFYYSACDSTLTISTMSLTTRYFILKIKMFTQTEINFIIFSNWQAFTDSSTEGFQIPPEGKRLSLRLNKVNSYQLPFKQTEQNWKIENWLQNI